MVIIRGRLNTNTAPKLEEELKPVLESKPHVLVFDLGELEFLSSGGLRTIFRAQKAVDSAGGKTLFLKLQPPVQRVFDVIKAIPATSIFASVQELDEYLDTL